jgi:dienelactone hydrolase
VGAAHGEPRFYDFTEKRLDWMTRWAIEKYRADPERVYCAGQSMGGSGTAYWAFRRPQTFAAVVAKIGRVRQRPSLGAVGLDLPDEIILAKLGKPVFLADGKTDFVQSRDLVRWVSEHREDLPFYSLACGRQDNLIPWPDQVDMARALAAGRHGFAMAWNNGGHSSQTAHETAGRLEKYYGKEKFALHRSYPAFSNSSIDDNPGNGDPKDGDLVGGINLGFIWSAVIDEPGKWSVAIENDRCKGPMTVDVTPRNRQRFKPVAGDKLKWTSSAGGAGEIVADRWGLVTIEKVKIAPGTKTILTVSR